MAEPTVAEKLKNLYELQTIDSKIDEIEILKGELPIEVSDLEDELAGMETRINKLTGEIEGLDSEISQQNAKIKEAEALIERYNTQLDNVKNNREYDALMKELEMQRLEIQLLEKKKAKVEESLETTRTRLDKKQKDFETKKVELEEISKKTEKEEQKLRKQSEKARKKIEDRLLRAYDKTRTTYRNGLAVVTVERSACGGCFNMIPPQLQLEISMRKKIIACEHCGRILVDDFVTDEEKKAEKA